MERAKGNWEIEAQFASWARLEDLTPSQIRRSLRKPGLNLALLPSRD